MKNRRILIVSLVGLLIFGALLGGKVVYQKKWVDVSILNQSQQIPGVVSAKVVNNNNQKEMIVETEHLTNLRKSSQTLKKFAKNVPIRFIDRRNDSLEKLFGQLQFAIQEGIVLGNFTEMAQNVRMQAEKEGVHLELEMDNEAIYVILNQGQAQLIEVIERSSQKTFLPTENNKI